MWPMISTMRGSFSRPADEPRARRPDVPIGDRALLGNRVRLDLQACSLGTTRVSGSFIRTHQYCTLNYVLTDPSMNTPLRDTRSQRGR